MFLSTGFIFSARQKTCSDTSCLRFLLILLYLVDPETISDAEDKTDHSEQWCKRYAEFVGAVLEALTQKQRHE